jgi:CRP-like cAMP-binding protein
MVERSELLHVPAFADLPEDQIDWFLSRAEERHLDAGKIYFRQGDPADAMFVILEGQLQLRGELGGETVVLTSNPGDVTVSFPFRE